jgi:hypothetical protein
VLALVHVNRDMVVVPVLMGLSWACVLIIDGASPRVLSMELRKQGDLP